MPLTGKNNSFCIGDPTIESSPSEAFSNLIALARYHQGGQQFFYIMRNLNGSRLAKPGSGNGTLFTQLQPDTHDSAIHDDIIDLIITIFF